MKIRIALYITPTANAAALLGTLTIAALPTTITAINTNKASTTLTKETGGNGPGYNSRHAPTIKPTGVTPQYQIFDIGVVDVGDSFSQGLGVSPAGIAVGRSVRNDGSHAFAWTQNGGIVGLPDLAGR